MRPTRRKLLHGTAALGVAAGLAACARAASGAEPGPAKRRMMINGNMVIPFSADGTLDKATTDMIRSTGLSAVKATVGGAGGTYEEAHAQLDLYDQGLKDNEHVYTPVRSVDDIDEAYRSGRIGVIKSFETAAMLDGKIERIAEFSERNVRIMQLCYNNRSPFGAGAMSTGENLGLTGLGRAAIAAMEAEGVLLDLSHAHEHTALDALAAATRPVAISHTGCASIHRHPRNTTDSVLKKISEAGGVVGIYELSYLTAGMDQTPLAAFLAHLEHAVHTCGEDHVGVGSDALLLAFDTGPESRKKWDELNAARKAAGVAAPGEGPMPFVIGLNGPHRMNTLAEQLQALGYKSSTIEKILGRNFYRVFSDSWNSASATSR